MTSTMKNTLLYLIVAFALLLVGLFQSWSVAFSIFNFCLISAIMALGVNIQWGYGGLFNAGVMGSAALGGLAAVLVSAAPIQEAWSAGGTGVGFGLLTVIATIALCIFIYRRMSAYKDISYMIIGVVVLIGYVIARSFFDQATGAIELVDAANTGFLGGLGLPIIFSWPVGGLLAAAAAWVVGKIALGLRSDYLAIATLGISEIIIAFIKNEDWLTRGVKNVTGLSRPVPYEVELQKDPYYQMLANDMGISIIEFSSLMVKISYSAIFIVVLALVYYLSEKAWKSPWGRMMRAIRDNEVSANAMGKNIKARHLQVFVLGSAVIGLAGAMLTTLDGQFTPTSYQPLRFTFLIWVMVIVGGSGNNAGAILGAFIVWFTWNQAPEFGKYIIDLTTGGLGDTSPLRKHLIANAEQTRLVMMGLILLLVLRFSPRGLIPEK
ncbi:MAG: branched-chain amino acid ABC transporter permease [Nitratireductor sp.]